MGKLLGSRRRMLAVGVAGVALGALAGPPVAATAVKAASDVFVTNDAAHPVPVTGSVGVTDKTPFQIDGHIALTSGQSPVGDDHVVLPAGKALIVEFVSAGGRDFDQLMIHSGTGNAGEQTYYLPLSFRDFDANNSLTTGSEMTRFRLDNDVYLSATLRDGAGNSSVEWIIAGYLVDE